MPRIIRITNTARLRSPDPLDTTRYYTEATHVYFYFTEYRVLDNGLWVEDGARASTVSVEELANLLDEAKLLREIAPSKQSGGNDDDQAV